MYHNEKVLKASDQRDIVWFVSSASKCTCYLRRHWPECFGRFFCKKNFLFDFSFLQVENVHWKCICAAQWCIIKINKNKNKINLRNHEFVRKKKQNDG